MPLPFARRRGWRCQVHRARPTRCRFAQPVCSTTKACTQQAVKRVWAHRSWIGCAQGSWDALHHQSRRREKGAVSQPLLRRLFRRLLLFFVPPMRPFTIPTVGHLPLGSPPCIVYPKTCCENRGQIALFSAGAIEHWEHNRALS